MGERTDQLRQFRVRPPAVRYCEEKLFPKLLVWRTITRILISVIKTGRCHLAGYTPSYEGNNMKKLLLDEMRILIANKHILLVPNPLKSVF